MSQGPESAPGDTTGDANTILLPLPGVQWPTFLSATEEKKNDSFNSSQMAFVLIEVRNALPGRRYLKYRSNFPFILALYSEDEGKSEANKLALKRKEKQKKTEAKKKIKMGRQKLFVNMKLVASSLRIKGNVSER